MNRFVLGVLTLQAITFAATPAKPSDTVASIEQSLKIIGQAATRIHDNESYQPYIITVLDGKSLEKRGFLTLEDALATVPGVDISTDLMDMKRPVFRGSNPYAFGQTKLLIDGMLANNTFFDNYVEYLQMPLALIKRIEVVRGPGSRTDGVNAYAGTINIVTYAEPGTASVNKIFLTGGTYDTRRGGFVCGGAQGEFHYHVDGFVGRDGKTLFAGPDILATGAYAFPELGIDNAPLAQSGNAPLQTDNWSLGLSLRYGAWYVRGRATGYRHGSAYGINGMLPQLEDRIEVPAYLAEAGYEKRMGSWEVAVRAGARFGRFESHAMLAPKGLTLPLSTPPYRVVFTEGFYGIHRADQRAFYQSTYFKYSGFQSHYFTIGYRIEEERTTGVVTKTTDRITGTGLTDYSETAPFIDPEARRSQMNFSLQDQADVTEKVSILYGVNVEKTSLSKWQFDPRVSIVYQLDSFHIFKAIYSHSHRTPSWQELFVKNNSARVGNRELAPEQVDAFETAFIRKFNSTDALQIDAFYLHNFDQIDKNNPENRYENAHDTFLYGLEFEYHVQFGGFDRFGLTYAYADGRDESGQSVPNIARHIAGVTDTHDFGKGCSGTLYMHYIGEKTRAETDARPAVKAVLTADATIRYAPPSADGFALTMTVHNLANASGAYPSEPKTYVNDYPQDGRTFFLKAEKSF